MGGKRWRRKEIEDEGGVGEGIGGRKKRGGRKLGDLEIRPRRGGGGEGGMQWKSDEEGMWRNLSSVFRRRLFPYC